MCHAIPLAIYFSMYHTVFFLLFYRTTNMYFKHHVISKNGSFYLYICDIYVVVRACLVWRMRWSIIFSLITFCIWFVELNELIHHHLIPHKLIIISICMRNELIPPKIMRWTHNASPHEAWDDSINQTHHDFSGTDKMSLFLNNCFGLPSPRGKCMLLGLWGRQIKG